MQGPTDSHGSLLTGTEAAAPGTGRDRGGSARGPGRRQRGGRTWIPWLGLGLCLLATLVAGLVVGWTARSYDRARFDNAVQTTHDRIGARMTTIAALLRGAESYFSAERGAISATEFSDYVHGLELEQHYPGVLGLGFSLRIAPAASPLVDELRQSGLGSRQPWPGGVRQELHSIVFLEPPGLANEAAIGFDMASEATRREAMVRAEATGEPALSGRVRLKQEPDHGQQAGFLLYMPVYVGAPQPASVRERRARLLGFVYSPFRAGDLFEGIFGSEQAPEVDFEVYDGVPEADHLLHRSNEAPGLLRRPAFTSSEHLQVFGRDWTLRFSSRPALEQGTLMRFVPWIWLVGSALSALVFLLLRGQADARRRAEQHAMTLRRVMDSEAAGIAITDPRGRIHEANDAFLRIVGRRREELRDGGLWISTLTPPQHHAADARALEQLHLTGRAPPYEKELLRPDGTRVPVQVGVAPLPGHEDREVCLTVDLSERKRFERALRQSEERFQLASRATNDAIWDFDPATGRIHWAGGGAALFGHRIDESTGFAVHESRVHPGDRTRFRRAWDQLLINPRRLYWAREYRYDRGDGTWVHVSDRGFVVRDDSGTVVRVVGAMADVTVRHLADEERASLLREAQEGVRVRDEFLSVASHELKTPLTTLSLRLQKLALLAEHEDAGPIAEEFRVHLEQGQRQIRKLAELMNDLLDVARIDSGRLRMHPEALDLSRLARDVCARYEDLARRAHSELLLDTVGPVTGSWDALRLDQILDNLLSNALKYGAGQPVHVRVRAGEGGHVRLTVRDRGIGIEPEQQQRIFERFERAVSERHYGGLGLGLYVTRSLVESMGGTIQVESRPGEGATFVVDLPRGLATPAQEPVTEGHGV